MLERLAVRMEGQIPGDRGLYDLRLEDRSEAIDGDGDVTTEILEGL